MSQGIKSLKVQHRERGYSLVDHEELVALGRNAAAFEAGPVALDDDGLAHPGLKPSALPSAREFA